MAMSRNRVSSMSQQKELRRIENESHIQTNDFLSFYSVNIVMSTVESRKNKCVRNKTVHDAATRLQARIDASTYDEIYHFECYKYRESVDIPMLLERFRVD